MTYKKDPMYWRALTSNFVEDCLADAIYLLQTPECSGIGDGNNEVVRVAEMLLKLRMLNGTEKYKSFGMYWMFATEIPQDFNPDTFKEEEE